MSYYEQVVLKEVAALHAVDLMARAHHVQLGMKYKVLDVQYVHQVPMVLEELQCVQVCTD